MRTTIALDDELVAKAQQFTENRGQTDIFVDKTPVPLSIGYC